MGGRFVQGFELIYYIYFLFIFGAKAAGLNEGSALFNSCIVIGGIFFAVKILSTKTTLLEYIITAFITLSGVLTYFFSGEKGLLLCFTMMLGMKGISEKKVLRLGLCILAPLFFILYILSVTGVLTGLDHIYKKSGYGFLLRRSLGYPYPNTTHTTFLILIMLFFCVYEAKSIKKLIMTMIISMILSLYLYLYTVSLTGIISVTIFLAVTLYLNVRKNRSRLENILIELLFPFIVIFSITGPLVAKGEVFDFLDSLLHKRYEYALYFLQNERVTLFGSKFATPPTNWYMIDNSFLYLFLQLGIIPFMIVCALYLMWIHDILKKNKKKELAIIITFMFIGMSDPFLFNLSFKNLTLIFIGAFIYEKTKEFTLRAPGSALSKEILILPQGQVRLPDFKTMPAAKYAKAAAREISEYPIRYITIFVLALVVASATYHLTVPVAEHMYVDEDIVDPFFSHKSTQMTQSEVNAAIANGDIVLGYDSSNPTMYIFGKSATGMEHYRGVVTTGMLFGLIAVILANIFILIRKKQ